MSEEIQHTVRETEGELRQSGRDRLIVEWEQARKAPGLERAGRAQGAADGPRARAGISQSERARSHRPVVARVASVHNLFMDLRTATSFF